MAVVVLGGAGHIGSGIVLELLRISPELEVVIADKNVEKGNELVRKLGGNVSVIEVDAEDFSSLVEAFRRAEAVVSALGPFYLHGERVLKAAIKAGVNLVDVNDDYDATERCLKLDCDAKKAGIVAIIGLGATPGITNIMAKYGARGIEVEEINTAWAWTAVDPSMGGAIVKHFFHAITGEVPTYRDGKIVMVKALSEPEIVEFPHLGKMEVSHVGHPEPITIPRYIRARSVTNKGTIWPRALADMAKSFARIGLTRDASLSLLGRSVILRDLLVDIVLKLEDFISPELMEEVLKELQTLGEYAMGLGIRVEVRGKRGDEEIRRLYSLSSPSAVRATALPAALGVLEVMKRGLDVSGVYPPEGAIEPSKFLKELAKEFEIWEVEERRSIVKP